MISIITPFKNAEDWIGRCCKSMLDMRDGFEFILVDDGSTDASCDIAELYVKHANNIWIIDNKCYPGVSGARNTGIEEASGEWITFLDADDYLAPEAAITLRRAADLNADIVQMDHHRYYTSIDKLVCKYKNEPGEYRPRDLPDLWCMVWNKLYRRSFLDDDLRFLEGMQYGEDELFNLECLAKAGRIFCIDGCATVHCFDNKNSLARSKTPAKLWKQIQELEDFLESQEDPEIRKAVCRILSEHWRSETYETIIGQGVKE